MSAPNKKSALSQKEIKIILQTHLNSCEPCRLIANDCNVKIGQCYEEKESLSLDDRNKMPRDALTDRIATHVNACSDCQSAKSKMITDIIERFDSSQCLENGDKIAAKFEDK